MAACSSFTSSDTLRAHTSHKEQAGPPQGKTRNYPFSYSSCKHNDRLQSTSIETIHLWCVPYSSTREHQLRYCCPVQGIGIGISYTTAILYACTCMCQLYMVYCVVSW